MMKKKLFLFSVLFCGIFAVGYAAPRVVDFDPTVPAEETFELWITSGLTLISINDKAVSFKDGVIVRIPAGIAGERKLIFDVEWKQLKKACYANKIPLLEEYDFKFEAGQRYTVKTVPLINALKEGDIVRIKAINLSNPTTKGLLTINGLDEFNGKYISLLAQIAGFDFIAGSKGWQEKCDIGVLIENGKAEIPLFLYNSFSSGLLFGPSGMSQRIYESFNGNVELKMVNILIGDEELLKKTKRYVLKNFQIKSGQATINYKKQKK